MKVLLKSFGNWEISKLIFFFFILLGTGAVFTLTSDLFPSTLISVMLFFIFSPIIDSMERRGVSRSQAILGLFLVCGFGIGVVTTGLMPRVSQELNSFQKGSSRYSSYVSDRLKAQEEKLIEVLPFFKGVNVAKQMLGWVNQSSEKFWRLAPNLASHLLMCLFLVPFLTFILLRDGHELRRQLLKLVPNRHFETIYSLSTRILDEMGGYVAARIIEAFLVMGIVTVGCLVAKVPYAFLIGFFAGATNPIPYLGPLLGAIPAIAFAILEPTVPNQLFWVTLILFIANFVDMVVIFPLVVAKIVDLHPVIVVISVILGSKLFGVVGMIVAVPITSILKILIQEIYTRVYNTRIDSKIG